MFELVQSGLKLNVMWRKHMAYKKVDTSYDYYGIFYYGKLEKYNTKSSHRISFLFVIDNDYS